MSKHTPGPWTADQSTRGDRPDAWNVYGPDDSPYSNPGDLYLVADNLTKANARLIAAAPELLEALRNLIGCLEDGGDAGAPSYRHAVKAGKRILARAKGKEGG